MRQLLVVSLLLAGGLAFGQEQGLSKEGKAFLDRLGSAGWTGHSAANGLDVTARLAPICSPGMLNAVKNRKALNTEQAQALDDIVRVVLPAKGWFLETIVPAGKYRLGFGRAGGELETVLFDESGRRLGSKPFWMYGSTDDQPKVSAIGGSGAVTARVEIGGVKLDFRFVPMAAHDRLTESLPVYESGPVRLYSDLPSKTECERLVKHSAASLAIHAKLLGCPVPKAENHVYLYADRKKYEEIDRLLTDGQFQSTRAFTSRVTGWSYLAYGPLQDAAALSDHGFTLKARSLVLHELHHQLAGHAFPRSTATWPDWLAEGLAELGAQRSFASISKDDGRAFDDLLVGQWLHADRTGSVPPVSDLIGGVMKSGRNGYYATCYLLVKEIAGKPKRLHQLLAAVSRERVDPEAAVRARAEFVQQYGAMEAVLTRTARAARGLRKKPPSVMFGYRDPVEDAWRLSSTPDEQARVILPEAVEKADGMTVTTTFSYHPSGQQQLDVYLCYREGRHTAQFLKVAILPKKMMLFWFRHGLWRTCGTRFYDTALAIGSTTDRVWHNLKIGYRVEDRKLRVDTTGGRWVEFDVPGYVPCVGTRAAIGVYNGVAYVKDPVVR